MNIQKKQIGSGNPVTENNASTQGNDNQVVKLTDENQVLFQNQKNVSLAEKVIRNIKTNNTDTTEYIEKVKQFKKKLDDFVQLGLLTTSPQNTSQENTSQQNTALSRTSWSKIITEIKARKCNP